MTDKHDTPQRERPAESIYPWLHRKRVLEPLCPNDFNTFETTTATQNIHLKVSDSKRHWRSQKPFWVSATDAGWSCSWQLLSSHQAVTSLLSTSISAYLHLWSLSFCFHVLYIQVGTFLANSSSWLFSCVQRFLAGVSSSIFPITRSMILNSDMSISISISTSPVTLAKKFTLTRECDCHIERR